MMMKSTLITAVLVLVSVQAQANFPTCAAEAASEFEVPQKVFQAMVLEVEANPYSKGTHYGPMGLYDLSIPLAADGVGVSDEAVRTDPCVNYYAAAWWLMNEAGGSEGDIWDAVANYYHGHKDRDSYPMRDRVRAIYDQL